uniref:Uncharacterized protein n=1 Tax=uncultured prokaryote TaxID=198431 RepID=A0A0H5Q5X1_9ZZZZ|nr:hypothetical protein [uncultured prokaryote]
MVIEILTDWKVPNGKDGVSVMYFNEGETEAESQERVGDFFGQVMGEVNNGVSFSVRNQGRILDAITGDLTGMWTLPDRIVDNGDSSSQVLPNEVQLLFRWSTANFVGSRQLKGRTFLPGMTVAAMSNGELGPSPQATLEAAIPQLIDGGTFVVWHRPVNGAGGFVAPVTVGTVWREFAVLRSRR